MDLYIDRPENITQWSTEKVQTMIYKALYRKLKIQQRELAKNRG